MRQAIQIGFRMLGVGLLAGMLVLAMPGFAKPKAHATQVVAKAMQLSPPGGGFSVTLPAGFGNVEKRVTPMQNAAGTFRLTTFSAGSSKTAVAVNYNDFPKSHFESQDIAMLLKRAQDGALSGMRGTLQQEKSLSWYGYPARMVDFYIEYANGEREYWRSLFVAAKPRLFQVICYSRNPSDLDGPRLRQFINSFRVFKTKA